MGASRRFRALGILVLVFGAILLLAPTSVVQPVDDLVVSAAAVAATSAAAWRARSLAGRARLSWALLGAAFGAASAGEITWTTYELGLNRATPSPSLADVGYLAFYVLALAGVLLRPAGGLTGQGRLRPVLDGLLVVGSMFNIAWATALGSAWHSDHPSPLAFAVNLAYPAGDVLVLTTVLLLVTQSASRRSLGLMGIGLAIMAIADSGFTYLSVVGGYETGNLVDLGYLLSYLLLMEAALQDHAKAPSASAEVSRWLLLLPYLPVAAAVTIAAWHFHPTVTDPTVLVGSALVLLLLLRQAVTLLDNHKLLQHVLISQEALRHQAFHDSLTSLANRALFMDRLGHAVDLHRRNLRPVGVLVLDLDDFKEVNDTLGHPVGDDLLVRVAERLQAATRTGDTVARLGGDEFAVLVEDDGDLHAIAERILLSLDRPVEVAGRRLSVQASIGLACLAADAAPVAPADLLGQADLAMYAAKREGKGAVALYRPGMTDDVSELHLRSDLVNAINRGEVEVWFQPLFSLTGAVLGAEALSRWTRAGTPVAPDVFIPAAERAGVLQALDDQVLEKAIALAGRAGVGFVSVNTSVSQLSDPALPDRIEELLARHAVVASRLVLEVPENRVLASPESTLLVLNQLRELGVRVALDDFGTGFSSLARLQDVPADIIKIDRCFITPLGTPGADTALVSAMIDLAHRTGATVVAEGVELPLQAQRLAELGCDILQGYLLGKAVPAREALAHLTSRALPIQARSQVPSPACLP